jgi:multidrug efflux system membrane fusion protein
MCSIRRCFRIAVAGLAALLVIPAGCSRVGKGAPTGGGEVPPSKVNLRRNVVLTKAVQQPLVYTVETVGLIEAEGQTELAAGVAGNVDEVNFREGDIVDPSDLEPLVRISVPLYKAAAEAAQFEVRRAESRAEEARKNLALAKKNWDSLSETEKLQRESADAVARAELSSAKAALDRALYNQKRSQLMAPYRGRINKRMVTKGSYVEDKTVIATMADLSRLRLTTFIPESATATVRELMDRRDRAMAAAQVLAGSDGWPGMAWWYLKACDLPADFDPEFTALPLPKKTFRAKMFYLSTVGDPSTHQFECKAEIMQAPDTAVLLPGFTSRVRVPLETRADAVLVPEEALRSTERGWLVFIPEKRLGKDGQTEWLARAVTVDPGYHAKGMVEIRKGLSGHEFIVHRGADALEEMGGTPIHVPDEQLELLEGRQ